MPGREDRRKVPSARFDSPSGMVAVPRRQKGAMLIMGSGVSRSGGQGMPGGRTIETSVDELFPQQAEPTPPQPDT